ncbi:MAG: hypothetical protein Q8N23_03075 [Archangium sp.]|nr:hypothetical protein [Archangium sp.]
MTLLEFSRIVLKRYRWAALFCALLTFACAVLASQAVPEMWPVEAQVLVVEPVVVHRLANPFAAVPSSPDELKSVPELLKSRERLVSIVKRTGLIDQWDAGRPWPLKLKDRLQVAVLGPVEEKDRLEALVAILDKRLSVTVEANKVRIFVEWPTPELALALVENTLGTLLQLRAQREGKTLQDAADALDVQLLSVRGEMDERVNRMKATLLKPGGWAQLESDKDQLFRDQSRAADLMVAAEEKRISAEVFRQSNTLRFNLVRPPMRPREPSGNGHFVRVVTGVVASIVAGLVGALMLALTSRRILSGNEVKTVVGLPVLSALRQKVKERVLPTRKGLLLWLLVAIFTGAAVGFSKGRFAVSILPPLAFVGAWLLWTRPLKWPFLLLALLAVTLDDPTDRAYVGVWQSPLFAVGRAFFGNVALFTGIELAILGLTGLMVLRRIWMPREQLEKLDPIRGQAPRPLQLALIGSILAVGALVVMGMARGGDFREALWQFRALLMLPIIASLALYALDIPKDLPKLFGVLVVGSLVKALLGIFFMYAIAFPQGVYPPHTTGHNDTMLFVTAVVTALTLFWEKPIRRHFWLMLLWVPVIALALKLNDRRIAYVDIVMALGLIAWLSPMHEMKRKLKRVAVALAPVVLLYLAVGWNAPHSRIFGPAQKVRSIIAPAEDTEEESSNVERDIENYNLTKTWENNMFFGQGFGHAFTEYVPSNDFRQSGFGHVGHNSILWLMWIGGIFGFTAVFAYLAVALFFLGRALPSTADWRQRVALLVSLSVIVTYLMQAFGDMGTQSEMFDLFVGSSLAIIGRLATRVNAWKVPAALPVQDPEAITV